MNIKCRDDFEEAVATGAICDGFRHQMCSYIAFMKSIKDMRTKFGYTEPVIDGAYKIWKASRAALVVELPSFENGSLRGYSGDCDEANIVVDCLAESLQSAGVNYK